MVAFLLSHSISILIFLLTLVFVSFVLRENRAPGSTMAWLILMLVAPFVGIPLYLLIGVRKIPARFIKKEQLFRSKKSRKALADFSGIQRILSVSNIPDAKKNESLELLTTGEIAFERYLSLIKSAEKSIYVTTFIMGNDEVGEALTKALSDKAAAGLDVRLLVDSLGATLLSHPSLKPYQEAGGKTAYFMPFLHRPFRGRTNLRNHRKLMIIDEKIAIVGGMNLAKEYMGPSEDENRWTDLAVQVKGASVFDFIKIFFQDWHFATKENALDTDPETNDGEGPLAQVVASGPDVSGDPIYDVLLSSIHSAQKKILIVTPYFIPDESLAKAIELSAKRGVKVQILIPRKSNHGLADIARGSFIRQLENVGVEFSYYTHMIHAKVVMIDGSVGLLGSANFDMRSLLLNYELGLLIYDEKTLDEVQAWVDECMVRTTKGYSRETFARQILEGIGRVIGPFI